MRSADSLRLIGPLSHGIPADGDYVIFRIILFSTPAAFAFIPVVHTNILPLLVVLSYGVMSPAFGQPESVLALEQPNHGKLPFHKGEQWDIQSDATISPSMMRIAVLDTTHWPWVLVKREQGEEWLNFDHVVMAKAVAAAK